MRSTTSRAHRREGILRHGRECFDTYWDWFLFVHLDRWTQTFHWASMIVALPFFPWATWRLLHLEALPMIAFCAVYYGTGFTAHWLFDGVVSPTVPEPMMAYRGVLRLNFGCILGTIEAEEQRLLERYPFVREVYLGEPASAGLDPLSPPAPARSPR